MATQNDSQTSGGKRFVVGLSLGIGVGAALGVAWHNLVLGMVIGLAIGASLGFAWSRAPRNPG